MPMDSHADRRRSLALENTMTSFRFFHAADIHLDSPLTGLAGIEGRVAERIRSAPRAAFEALVDRATQDQVDFLVIAGDLYDGTWRDYKTGLFFAEQMGRLNQAGIPVFVLHGNHDAESQITRPLALPDNVRVFGTRKAQTFPARQAKCCSARPQFSRESRDRKSGPGLSSTGGRRFQHGVLHTALGGMGNHANYAPCSLPELVAKGYDYWALGHVHQGQVLNERPHVVFPGNLQGRHVREAGPKGACLVTVDVGPVVEVEALMFDVVRWAVLDVGRGGGGQHSRCRRSDAANRGAGGRESSREAAVGTDSASGPHRASQSAGDGRRELDG